MEDERRDKILRLVEENLAKEGHVHVTYVCPQQEGELAAHACTQETIDRILDRIRATDPAWIENIEKAMQEPTPLERLVGPEITGEHLATSADYKNPPCGELDKSVSGNERQGLAL